MVPKRRMTLDARSIAMRSLLMTGDPVTIRVPSPSAENGQGNVRVTLLSGLNRIGIWEFRVQFQDSQPILRLSPVALDQCFLTIDHPHSPPIAYRHELSALPETADGLKLQIETELVPWISNGWEVYRLKWPTTADAEQQLEMWRVRSTPPIQWFYVELTTHCNLSCPFCPSSRLQRPRTFMSVEFARQVFQQIAEYRALNRTVLGYARLENMVFLHVMGEPLLHPKFEEIVTIARAHGIEPTLFTNVTLLTDRNIQKIFNSGVGHVNMSINVVSPIGYRGLGAKGTIVDQERRVVRFLRERAVRGAFNVHVDLQYITSAGRTVVGEGLVETRKQVWELVNHWLLLTRSLEANANMHAGLAQPIDPGAIANPLASQQGGDASVRFPLSSGITLTVKSGCSFGNVMLPRGLSVLPTDTGYCPFNNPSRVMCIFVDGSVSFCSLDYENSISVGNLHDETIGTIWSSKRMQRIREKMEKGQLEEPLCQRCLGQVVSEELIPQQEGEGR